MTGELEQWATTIYQEQGNDPTEPDFQSRVGEIATTMREAAPGADDATIIAQVGPAVQQKIAAAKSVVPAASKVDTPGSNLIAQQMAALQTKYSPEAEQAKREETRNSWANIGADAGRNLSAGYRVNATGGQRAQLDEMYTGAKAAAAQPYADWQATKKAAVADIEQRIKMQSITREEAKYQMTKVGFDQAQQERQTKEDYTAAINDPASAHSEALRALARQKFPKFAEGLGAKFDTLSYAILSKEMPGLEKQFEKELDLQDKELARRATADEKDKDRTSTASEKDKDRAARQTEFNAAEAGRNSRNSATIAAANARAANKGPAVPKEGDRLRALSLIQNIDKGINPDKETLNAITRSQQLVAEAEKLIIGPNSVKTGPVVGALFDSALGRMMASPERQRVDQITGDLANQLMMAAKGAQTEGDAQRMRAIIDMLRQSDPGPGIKAAKEALNRSAESISSNIAEAEALKAEVRGRPAPAPAPASDFDSQWAKLKSGQSLVGPDGKTYTKK